MNREDAIRLLKKYNKDEFHIRHAITVEQVMKYFAKKYGKKLKKLKIIMVLFAVQQKMIMELMN